MLSALKGDNKDVARKKSNNLFCPVVNKLLYIDVNSGVECEKDSYNCNILNISSADFYNWQRKVMPFYKNIVTPLPISNFDKGCQMEYFHTKPLNFDGFWKALQWKFFIYIYDHLASVFLMISFMTI
jgi:hypothetical protein